ncbi:hypothetical protein ACFQ05_11715 [Amycolatopsis umgeniensis]|uniref:Uncharacterized protein n=1 Tax=Amycolatopsis umgeniensis TaxID=336628 RepID=A0A841B1H9_9PSEU|nr:hypothetical protein [Amycolatopsis umgeniensis]MBB5853966.1 hypothetical protein [Amycolatopsis umgeniensis]
MPADDLRRPLMTAHLNDLAERVNGPTSVLDLHLDGPGVEGHTTNAGSLAAFLKALDEVIKNVAKSTGRLARFNSALRVTPTLGSVRLLVAAPDVGAEAGALPTKRPEPVEEIALRRLVVLMNLAQKHDEPTSAVLDAALHDLSSPARDALAKFAKVTRESTYELYGHWADASRGTSEVRLSMPAASRLEHAAGDTVSAVAERTIVGTVDGWEWSSSTVRFAPQVGRAFRASVPEHLAPMVARLVSSPDLEYLGHFKVVTMFKRGSNQPGRSGYSLEKIQTSTKRNLAE